ncbi:hypothetical protein DSO57_1031406 [Entomophthora muscae]|uniref:Uncharacterized protein n=1 Tax=Entomophthora muscae TaxID=34485 RepID=A0ACC2S2R3_9FUNG|nr:hypothetical protein DSO57_1031406 [Entomophthora muscae]
MDIQHLQLMKNQAFLHLAVQVSLEVNINIEKPTTAGTGHQQDRKRCNSEQSSTRENDNHLIGWHSCKGKILQLYRFHSQAVASPDEDNGPSQKILHRFQIHSIIDVRIIEDKLSSKENSNIEALCCAVKAIKEKVPHSTKNQNIFMIQRDMTELSGHVGPMDKELRQSITGYIQLSHKLMMQGKLLEQSHGHTETFHLYIKVVGDQHQS